jgi:hypothetical protein
LTSLLLTFCNQMNTNINSPTFVPACMSATKAATIQSGVGPSVDNYISRQQNYYQPKVIEKTGQASWFIASGAYMIYSKNMVMSTSFKPVADTLRIEANSTSGTVNLTWSF